MTDYRALNRRINPEWRRRETKKSWGSFTVLVIAIFFLIIIGSGFAKSFADKNQAEAGKWDSRFSFVSAVLTKNPSVAVYQQEPERLVVMSLDSESYVPVGDSSAPLVKISEVVNKKDGEALSKTLSHAFGTKIDNFVIFEDQLTADVESVKSAFVKFSSFSSGISIITGKYKDELLGTNIPRVDMFRLWWKVKNLSINQVEFVDLSAYKQEVIAGEEQKVLGVDDVSLNKFISKYLENDDVASSDVVVKIINASGNLEAANLAAEFVTSFGLVVRSVESTSLQGKTLIRTSKNKDLAVNYLAKVFECDILGDSQIGQEGSSEGNLVGVAEIVIGEDFAQKYF